MNPPTLTIRPSSFVRVLATAFVGALVGATSADDLDERANRIRPQPSEELWRTIPWCATVAEAERQAKSEGRPIFVFTTSGPPFEHC